MDITQYILGIMTCKNNLHKAEDQYNKYLKKISLYPIIYIKFIGDPTLQDEYVYDEINHLLTLKCEDDYVNLPNKVYCFFKAIRELFPNFTNLVKIDDDVVINLPILYEMMLENKYVPYAGNKVKSEVLSWFFTKKPDVCAKYPEFAYTPFYLNDTEYCAGCAYFLNKDSVLKILKHPEFFEPFKNNYMDYVTREYQVGELKNFGFFLKLYPFEDHSVGLVLNTIYKITIKDIIEDLKLGAYWDNM
jgi:hypothetical protein